MQRYLLAQVQVINGTRTPTVPAAATGWVCLFEVGNRMLVKATLPDGAAKTANTIADITHDEDGRQVDINNEPLTAAQKQAAKTFLVNNGIDVERFDGDNIDDRAKLLRFLLRRIARWQDMTVRELLDGWDVA